MVSRAQSQGRVPSPHRDSASLSPTPAPGQPPPHHPNPWTSGDGWDFQDAGPSFTPTNPKQHSGDASSADESADPGRVANELTAIFLEKAVRGNRAKLPDPRDDLNRPNGTLAASNRQPDAPAAANPPSRRKRKSPVGPSHSSITGREPRSADNTFLWKVGLNWSREKIEGGEKVSLTASTPNHDASRESEDSVLWQ